jgi:hypothetical protein
MVLKELDARGAIAYFSANELLLLTNALNEVCNGLDLPEFATRLGTERDEALQLLKSIGGLYDRVVQHPAETVMK